MRQTTYLGPVSGFVPLSMASFRWQATHAWGRQPSRFFCKAYRVLASEHTAEGQPKNRCEYLILQAPQDRTSPLRSVACGGLPRNTFPRLASASCVRADCLDHGFAPLSASERPHNPLRLRPSISMQETDRRFPRPLLLRRKGDHAQDSRGNGLSLVIEGPVVCSRYSNSAARSIPCLRWRGRRGKRSSPPPRPVMAAAACVPRGCGACFEIALRVACFCRLML